MAALQTGVQYGLSSRSSNENTSLIFVKLTDSAFRAIEKYLENVDRTTQKPTIQFLNNNKGHLSIPTQPASSSRPEVFTFSLSPNSDEGTFECLQSTGSRALESLGALSHNMCIQAKDDVYEATKHRMAVVEEQQKKNRTKVIKPNVSEIGRKVKVIPGSTPSVTNHMSNNLSTGGLSGSLSRGLMHNPPSQQHSRVVSNNHAQKPGNPELMRRPLRERLIHVLALRPYKKPELFDRFYKEGLYEKDKKQLARALLEVATMKDNTYNLIRSVWNDVQEDWPFYTEQDRQILKRRKPQNLTPPGSSDTGSSGSGQSPTSTHPGSPPSVIQNTLKRPIYGEPSDVIPSKRRISHYHKQPTENSYRPHTESIIDNYHQEIEDDPHRNRPYGGDSGFTLDDRRRRIVNNNSKDRFIKKEEDRTYDFVKTVSSDSFKKSNNFASDVSNKRPNNNFTINNETDSSDLKRFNNSENNKIYERKLEDKIKRSDSPATVTSSQPQNGPKWDSSYTDTRTSFNDTDTIQENTVSASEIPDYLTEYTRITNDAQKRKYKEDFQSHYEEYKQLHAQMEKVSTKFAELEIQMKRTPRTSPDYQRIKKDIKTYYEEVKRDEQHQQAKKRFNYLHLKLSHIKKLVADYDGPYD